MYVDGIQGSFFKDREQFFRMWPRYPTKFSQGATSASTSGVITSVDLAGTSTPVPTVRVVSPAHGLTSGDEILIQDVLGTVELNNIYYTITLTPNQINSFNLVGTDVSGFSAYISGGTWTSSSRTFIFTLSGTPFLSGEVIIGGVDPFGNAISIIDDGNGNLMYASPNSVVSFPQLTQLDSGGLPIPGMKNLNTLNPGLLTLTSIGTVNYVSGEFNFTLPFGVSLASDSQFVIRVSQYQPGRPYSMLFWNNEFTIRPIPREIHKVEIETYLTPVQFLEASDSPILNQWWQYIALGSAIKILEDRQDMEGVENLSALFDRQEALVLERQGVEEINQKNVTIYSGSSEGLGWNNGSQGWFGW